MSNAQGRHTSRLEGPGEQYGEDEQPREQNSFHDPGENAFYAVTVPPRLRGRARRASAAIRFGFPNEILIIHSVRELCAGHSVQAHAALRRFQSKSSVNFRRHSDHELSAVFMGATAPGWARASSSCQPLPS